MLTRRGRLRAVVTVCAAAGAALLMTVPSVFSADLHGRIVLIGRSPYIRSLDQNQIQQIFSGQLKQWPDKTAVRVFVRSSDSVDHRRFTEEILQVFPYQLQRAWDRNVFSGSGEAPTVVGSQGAMIEKTKNVPGAVGYILITGSEDLRGLDVREILQ